MRKNSKDLSIENTISKCGFYCYEIVLVKHILDNGYEHFHNANDNEVKKAIEKVGREWEKRKKELDENNAKRTDGMKGIMLTTWEFETGWAECLFKLAKKYTLIELCHYMTTFEDNKKGGKKNED